MPDRLSMGADVVEAAIAAFESAPEHNSDRDPDTTNRVAMGLAIREALDKLGLREERISHFVEDDPDTESGHFVDGGRARLVSDYYDSDWRPVDAEPTSTACPDCVEGRTHDVQDGEPVVETCASCHGTGKSVRVDAEPSEPSHNGIPDSYWREVPCGHPPDPVAIRNAQGTAVCHCGRGLALVGDSGLNIEGAPGEVFHCDKCGCHVAVPSATSEGDPRG